MHKNTYINILNRKFRTSVEMWNYFIELVSSSNSSMCHSCMLNMNMSGENFNHLICCSLLLAADQMLLPAYKFLVWTLEPIWCLTVSISGPCTKGMMLLSFCGAWVLLTLVVFLHPLSLCHTVLCLIYCNARLRARSIGRSSWGRLEGALQGWSWGGRIKCVGI